MAFYSFGIYSGDQIGLGFLWFLIMLLTAEMPHQIIIKIHAGKYLEATEHKYALTPSFLGDIGLYEISVVATDLGRRGRI